MTDEEIKKLLEENLKASQESLIILRKINRARTTGNIFYFFKWALIIGATIWGYLQLQPFINNYLNLINQFSSGVENINKISNNINSTVPPDMLKILQNFGIKK